MSYVSRQRHPLFPFRWLRRSGPLVGSSGFNPEPKNREKNFWVGEFKLITSRKNSKHRAGGFGFGPLARRLKRGNGVSRSKWVSPAGTAAPLHWRGDFIPMRRWPVGASAASTIAGTCRCRTNNCMRPELFIQSRAGFDMLGDA